LRVDINVHGDRVKREEFARIKNLVERWIAGPGGALEVRMILAIWRVALQNDAPGTCLSTAVTPGLTALL